MKKADLVKEVREKVRSRAAALEEISGTAGLRAIFEVINDLEVGIMREAFALRDAGKPVAWDYYAGLRDGVVQISAALRATIGEGEALREQGDEEDDEVTPDDLGISFGAGSIG